MSSRVRPFTVKFSFRHPKRGGAGESCRLWLTRPAFMRLTRTVKGRGVRATLSATGHGPKLKRKAATAQHARRSRPATQAMIYVQRLKSCAPFAFAQCFRHPKWGGAGSRVVCGYGNSPVVRMQSGQTPAQAAGRMASGFAKLHSARHSRVQQWKRFL